MTTDLADEDIKHMQALEAAAPDQPFFVYYVPGGTHSAQQPKAEWVEKFKGKFDMGKDPGGIRSQFHHIIDIVPMLLEVTGVPAPATFNGIEQKPIERVSMVYTFDETFDIGPDTRTGVDDSYDLPFTFTGTIDKLTYHLGKEQLTAAQQSDKAAAIARASN